MMKTETNPNMLMQKYLTSEIKESLASIQTSHGWTLEKAIKTGFDNPDSNIGIYAGDSESYSVFAPIFDPVIRDYHKYDMTGHKSDFSLEGLSVENIDPNGQYILSTRIRVGRNFKDFAFPSAISKQDRITLEGQCKEVLQTLPQGLKGTYISLDMMTDDERNQMIKDHFLFKQGDRFLESAGVNRDWPNNRGIFFSEDKKFLVWISEEDSMRIISMQQGGDIAEVFERLSKALEHINQHIAFAFDSTRGYHTTCPTNLGTAMRASVHIKIPKLSAHQDFEKICKELGLSIRGVDGEHSESSDGIYDISNKRRLGVSEREIFEELYNGVKKLIELESSL